MGRGMVDLGLPVVMALSALLAVILLLGTILNFAVTY